MNILFVGSIYSKKFSNYLTGLGLSSSSAGQTFQNALISGLDQVATVELLSEYFVPAYPKFKNWYIHSEIFKHNLKQDSIDSSIGFLNVPFLKKISQFFSYCKQIRKKSKDVDLVIVYEATSRQLLSTIIAASSKKKISIIPDLPEFMSDNRNIFYLLAKKFDRFLIDFSLKKFNGHVILSSQMKDRLKIKNGKYLILEGLYNVTEQSEVIDKPVGKILLYTGKIEKWFGLDDLLQAFCLIPDANYQLWLCGPGDVSMINSYREKDPRIKYFGCLTHDEVLVLQKEATILVNPRHSYDEFTLYSFPSKTMEYMASGTPTLMSPLKSLPDEYLKYLYLFDDESVIGMAKKIKEVMDKSSLELNTFGKQASKFIIDNKNSLVQAKRLISFVSSL